MAGKDTSLLDTMRSLLPAKRIVQIDPIELNTFSDYGGGGMHCITQQEPLLP